MRKDNISLLRSMTTLLIVLFHALGCYTYGWDFPYDKILAYDYFDLFIIKFNMPLFMAMSRVQQDMLSDTISSHHIIAPLIMFIVSLLLAWSITQLSIVLKLKYILG